jgi:NTE family protein
MIVPPYRISLSGGGIKGFAHVGVLEALEENGLLKAVHEYIGISAGALCALCLCIGCSLPELRKIILFLDFALIRDVDPETALNFTETFGIDTGANVKKLLSAILRGKKIDPHCTFAELESKKLGPSLRVIATNMNTCRPQEFSAKCSPGAELVFAVQASMSIPIYFTPVRDPESGHLFLDGGMMCSSPFKYLTDEEKRYTLSIVFGDDHKPTEKIETLYEFVSQLYYSTDFEHSLSFKSSWPAHTIIVPCGGINTIDFEANQESKEKIMLAGREAALRFISTPGKPPVRRFSIT